MHRKFISRGLGAALVTTAQAARGQKQTGATAVSHSPRFSLENFDHRLAFRRWSKKGSRKDLEAGRKPSENQPRLVYHRRWTALKVAYPAHMWSWSATMRVPKFFGGETVLHVLLRAKKSLLQ